MFAQNPYKTTFLISSSNTNDRMKELLVTYGPVGVPMYVNDSFSAYKSGVYSSCPDKATAEANLNHAVVVIGFDENGNYIIKNSWGTGWGMSGFGVVSKDPNCGISSAAYIYYSNAQAGEVCSIRIRWIWGMIPAITQIPRLTKGIWLG
jgi:C1A family cysteine protease